MRFRPANISLINSRFSLADDSRSQHNIMNSSENTIRKIHSLKILDWSFHTSALRTRFNTNGGVFLKTSSRQKPFPQERSGLATSGGDVATVRAARDASDVVGMAEQCLAFDRGF